MYEDKNAVYALNSYVRELIKVNLGWTEINGSPFLVPIAQQPELMTSGKPFIIYGWARHPADFLYQYVRESVSYTVFAADHEGVPGMNIVNQAVNLLSETFDRQDVAAADVNEWLDSENKNRKIGFSSVKTTVVEAAQPATEEGGHVAGLVMVESRYVKLDNNIVTRLEYTP